MASANLGAKARALCNASQAASRMPSQRARSMTTASTEQSEATRAAILRRRKHMPSSPHPQPLPNTTRFIITTKTTTFGQTEIERHFHGALTCLHNILGDVPYGRTQGVVSRTPIQMLPMTGAEGRGSMLAFKVFNASAGLRERIERELRVVEGVDGVRCEEGGSTG